MSKPFKPVVTLQSLKRLAHHIKVEKGLRHSAALDLAAQQSGYQNFVHARRVLIEGRDVTATLPPQRKPVRDLTEFQREARIKWENALGELLRGDLSPTHVWDDIVGMARVLNAVLGATDNHALLPTGGGMDLMGAGRSHEHGCLELKVRDRLAYVLKPRRLVLESFSDAMAESFFILEADSLDLADVEGEEFDDDYDRDVILARRRARGQQEVLELEPGRYVSRSVWDEGNLGYDSDGDEIPLPSSSRMIGRWLKGRFMILSTGSLWNGVTATYDGRHDRMSNEGIKRAIQYALDELADAA